MEIAGYKGPSQVKLTRFSRFFWSNKMESVFELASYGDGYEAVEKSSFIVRKLKKEGKIDESMIFLMQLALYLGKANNWKAASVAANRSIKLFPPASTTIKVGLKKMLFDFAESAPADAGCSDFYDFIESVIYILEDKEGKLSNARIQMAISNSDYCRIQFFYLQILKDQRMRQIFDPQSVILKLAVYSWRWVESIEAIEQREFTAQFILSRVLLALLSISENGIGYSRSLLSELRNQIPSSIDPKVLDSPLIHFTSFFIDSIERKNSEQIAQLLNKYQKIIEVDSEISKWITQAKTVHLSNDNRNPLDMRNVFQNIFGSLFPPNPN